MYVYVFVCVCVLGGGGGVFHWQLHVQAAGASRQRLLLHAAPGAHKAHSCHARTLDGM